MIENFLIKIGIATLIALVIGIDREFKRKGIGLKTILIITVASCLLTIISIEASFIYAESRIRVMDPARIPSYIISGIGFLGAGVILHKRNDAISGLTTAAMVWASAGLGIATGFGFYKEALIVALIIVLSVTLLPLLLKSVGPKKLRLRSIKVKMIVKNGSDLTVVLGEMKKEGLKLGHVKIKDLDNQNHQMDLTVLINEKNYITDAYRKLKAIDNVISIDIDSI